MTLFKSTILSLLMTLGAHHASAQVHRPQNALNLHRQPSQNQIEYSDKKEKLNSEWRFRMAGNSFNDEHSQYKSVDFRLDLRAKYSLTSSLLIDLQPSFRLISGQSQTVDGTDRMENRIFLTQAAGHLSPNENFKFSGGALNQRFMHSSLLIDEMAFPAARASTQYKSNSIDTSLSIETAIPTSTSLSTNTKELEQTPSLNSAAWSLKVNTENVMWKTQLGYFLFNHLPSSVAQQSLLLGNSVSNISDAKYYFLNEYQGLEVSSELKFFLTRKIELITNIEYLHNNKAIEEYSSAFKLLFGTNFALFKGIDWLVTGGYFYIAPDAAVAYFGSRFYETNRIGYSLESSIAFKPDNFKIGLGYTDSEVMFRNPAQTREKFLMIKLETFYANL